MASLGRRAAFAFPLGEDVVTNQTGFLGTPFGQIANEPTGIRFASLPLALRGQQNSQSVQARYSGIVHVVQLPVDKSSLNGVIMSKVGLSSIYGKTPSSVLATETRNANQFGFPILP